MSQVVNLPKPDSPTLFSPDTTYEKIQDRKIASFWN